MRKEIEFLTKFDTSEFDRSVETMKRRLQEVYRPADLAGSQMKTAGRLESAGLGGFLSKPAMDAFQKTLNQSKIEINKIIMEEAKNQEKLARQISKRAEDLNKLKEQYKELVDAGKEDLKLKQQIAEVEKNQFALREQWKRNDAVLNQAIDAREKLAQQGGRSGGGGFPSGGPPGGAGGAGGPGGIDFANIAKGLTTALGILAAGAAYADRYSALPQERTRALGSAQQNITGNMLQDVAGGNVVGLAAYAPERARAAAMAKRAADTALVTDQMKAPLSPIKELLGGVGIGQGGGRGFDAFMSNVLGAVGKAIETSPFSAPSNYIVKKTTGFDLPKKLNDMAAEHQATYEAKWLEEYAKNYQTNLDAEIQKNPLKKLAVDRLQQNYTQDLQTQRMLGLGYEGFHGRKGFQERANLAGFTGEMAVQQAREIQAAGGSTRGMNENSLLGLRAQRGFDLTNAGSILGKLSGAVGGGKETEQIFKKLLEEAVKNGLDKSNSVEELRKWSEITADVISKTGATTGESAAGVVRGFQSFMQQGAAVPPTMRELEGARSAYEKVQEAGAEATGRRGSFQFAGAVKAGLAPLGAKAIGGLMEMRPDEVVAENPFIQAMASKLGVEPQELVDKVKKVKLDTEALSVGIDPAKQAMMRKKGLAGKTLTFKELEELKKTDKEAYDQYLEGQEAVTAFAPRGSPQERAAIARRLTSGVGMETGGQTPTPPGIPGKEGLTPAQQVDQRLISTPSGERGRIEDAVVRSAGVAAQAMLENFRNFKDAITPASEAMDPFIKKVILLTQVMSQTPDKDKAAMGRATLDQFNTMNQPQAGKPNMTLKPQ